MSTSFELKGEISADVYNHNTTRNTKADGASSNVKVRLDLVPESAKRLGGDIFAKAVFCSFVGKSGEALHASSKPGELIKIKHTHALEIEGYPVDLKPVITNVKMGKKDRSAVLEMTLPVPVSAEKLCHMLLRATTGNPVVIKFKGQKQQEIPGTDKRHGFDAAKNGDGKPKGQGKRPRHADAVDGNGKAIPPDAPPPAAA